MLTNKPGKDFKRRLAELEKYLEAANLSITSTTTDGVLIFDDAGDHYVVWDHWDQSAVIEEDEP